MKIWTKVLLFCLGCVVFVGCDRVTKQLAKDHLMFREPKSYLNDTFRLEYAENTGATLSIGADLPQPYNFWLLSIVPLAVLLAFIVYVMRRLNQFSNIKLLAFAMIISGGLGNIIDRIVYDRHVTDFMNIGISTLRSGIFNVADVWITTGMVLLFISYSRKSQGLVQPDQPEAAN